MKPQTKIVQFDPSLRANFFEFAKLIHPDEKSIKARLEWYALGNPLLEKPGHVPGLFAVNPQNEIVGHFLMSPVEFYYRQKRFIGHFGYDFFVREDHRAHGIGALLFVQGVRGYKPFLGAGVTQAVEKISKAAGIKTISLLRKFLWINNPWTLGVHTLGYRLNKKIVLINDELAQRVEVAGNQFQQCASVPDDCHDYRREDDSIDLARSPAFLKWRFFDAPRKYYFYTCRVKGTLIYFVVRHACYQGMRLLLIVDYRFSPKEPDQFNLILRAVKAVAQKNNSDGVAMASTCVQTENGLRREQFLAVGRPSSLIANLPFDQFPSDNLSVSLTMADTDLDFSFGAPL